MSFTVSYGFMSLINMVYKMEILVDGGRRGNGRPGSIGTAAAAFRLPRGAFKEGQL
jgi:hypothetical protein